MSGNVPFHIPILKCIYNAREYAVKVSCRHPNADEPFPEDIIRVIDKPSRSDGRPDLNLIDLFSGCGGMALGFHRAGFRVVGGIDQDAQAFESFVWNFVKTGGDPPDFYREPHDILEVNASSFKQRALVPPDIDSVDVIIGGPPCQAFARIGRAKLREIMSEPEAHLNDHRANLYVNLLQYVEHFRPMAVVIENVPEILNFGGVNVAEEIACSLQEIGYKAAYTLLNSAHYGVPQTRSRMYLMALRKDLDIEPDFPDPTHYYELPVGYRYARRASLQLYLLDNGASHYVEAPTPSEDLPPAVTTREAIQDLPGITRHLEEKITGARTFDTLSPYRNTAKPSSFAREMREWPGFESGKGVYDHVIRYLPRDHEIFRRMRFDDQYPEAYALAMEIFQEELERIRIAEDRTIENDSPEYDRLRDRFVPPYSTEKFPNKWRKLHPDKPSHTLTAHMGKDTYSHIHYDDAQARVISVREAARLQSFPDGFHFAGAMNAAFTQIGNAVPPLQAQALGTKLRELIGASARAAW